MTEIGTRGSIGIGFNHTDDGIQIAKVLPGGTAEGVGILPGDLIISYDNNKPLNDQPSRRQFVEHIWHSPGQSIELKIKRGDHILKVDPRIVARPLYAEQSVINAIVEILALQEKHVGIAFMVEKVVNTASFPDEMSRQRWEDGIRPSLLTKVESMFLNALGWSNNFHVVDRSTLEEAFKEQRLQLSGAIDSATAKRIGQMVGASHLCLISLSRFNEGYNSFTDELALRLIDVESGTVSASSVERLKLKQ